MVAVIADRFHILPSVAARDLDEDPEQLSFIAMELLNYAEAKSAFDHSSDSDQLDKVWGDSKAMRQVEANTFSVSHQNLAHGGEIDRACAVCLRNLKRTGRG